MRILMLLSLTFTFSIVEASSDDEYYGFAAIANDSYSLSIVGTGEGNKHKLIFYSVYPHETKYKFSANANSGTLAPDPDYRNTHTKHQKYEFSKECRATYGKSWIPTSFKCDKNGHTPLAGASYKRVKYGNSMRDCEKGEPGFRYICTSGCDNSVAPNYLESDSGFSC